MLLMNVSIRESLGAKLILLGGGGHGRVLVDALRACGSSVDGLLDAREAAEVRVKDVRLLGDDHWLLSQSTNAIVLINGVGANPAVAPRAALFDRWHSAGFAFLGVTHPSAAVSPESRLGEGVQVLARAVIQTGAVVGENVVVNTGAILEHDVRVGTHVFVSPGAVVCGDVQIGHATFIGAGALVLPGVKVGNNAIVAAGATVTKDVADGAVVVGVPARERRTDAPYADGRGRTEN
jgi:sugar O-acyltransferase (sialic acid O-acetyltransferase NeuD family)